MSGSTSGSILRQSGGITLSYAGIGSAYDLRFPTSVRACVASATLGGATAFDSLGVAAGRYGISVSPNGDERLLSVVVHDNDDSTAQTAAFSLVVTCP